MLRKALLLVAILSACAGPPLQHHAGALRSPAGWAEAYVAELDGSGSTIVMLSFDGGCGAGAVSATGVGHRLELRWRGDTILEVVHPAGLEMTRNASGERIRCWDRAVRVVLTPRAARSAQFPPVRGGSSRRDSLTPAANDGGQFPRDSNRVDTLLAVEFWGMVDASATGDCERTAAGLGRRLRALPAEQIVRFDRTLTQRMIDAYSWDLWGVAYLVNGGESDDGFVYFRGWLIAQGRRYYEGALADPERAADRAPVGGAECEPMIHVAAEAYRSVTGRELPAYAAPYPREPTGTPWSEDDLPRRFPRVARRFTGLRRYLPG